MVLRTVLLWFVKSYLRILEILLNQYIDSDRKITFTTIIDQSLNKGGFSICRYLSNHFLNVSKYVSLTSWVQVTPWYFRRLLGNALFPWFLFKSSCYLHREGLLILLSLFYIPLILVKVFFPAVSVLWWICQSLLCVKSQHLQIVWLHPFLTSPIGSCSHLVAITNSSRTGGVEGVNICVFFPSWAERLWFSLCLVCVGHGFAINCTL